MFFCKRPLTKCPDLAYHALLEHVIRASKAASKNDRLTQVSEHYFSPQPTTPHNTREVDVRLDNRDYKLLTDSGVFSHGKLDRGTAALLQTAPRPPLSGALLDLGCGWGPIALYLALCSPQARIHAVDLNSRALDLAAQNAQRLGLSNIVVSSPSAVDPALRFTTIWSNPPIHVGKQKLHDMLMLWLPRLVLGGNALLVVQKNLGADTLHRWLSQHFPSMTTHRYATKKTFRVLEVRHDRR